SLAASREVLAQALLEKELGTPASETELKARYEAEKPKLERREINVQQIVVRVDPGAGSAEVTAARTRINALYARVLAGEPFEQVARESDDQATAQKGGELGTLLEGQVDQTFFEQAAALKKGAVSKPFQTAFG